MPLVFRLVIRDRREIEASGSGPEPIINASSVKIAMPPSKSWLVKASSWGPPHGRKGLAQNNGALINVNPNAPWAFR
jgi:hypothetical protein